MSLWTEVHRPKTLSEMIGCQDQIEKLHQWHSLYLQQVLEKSKLPAHPKECIKKGLLLVGPPGIGKTSIAAAFLRYYKWDFHQYSAVDVRKPKALEEQLTTLIQYTPKAIIMDEVDGLSSASVAVLQKIINPNRGKGSVTHQAKLIAHQKYVPPIICICNNEHTANIHDLSLDCQVINFPEPTTTMIKKLIEVIASSEGLTIEPAVAEYIATASQGDYRRTVTYLQNNSIISKNITLDLLNQSNQVYGPKTSYRRDSLLPAMILQPYDSYADMMEMYEIVKAGEQNSKIASSIHQNYLSLIDSHESSVTEKIVTQAQCINLIAIGDDISNMIRNARHSTKPQTLRLFEHFCGIFLPLELIHNNQIHQTSLFSSRDRIHHSMLHKNKNKISEVLLRAKQYRDISSDELHLITNLLVHGNKTNIKDQMKQFGIENPKQLDALAKTNKIDQLHSKHLTMAKRFIESKPAPKTRKKTKRTTQSKKTDVTKKTTSSITIKLKPNIINQINRK